MKHRRRRPAHHAPVRRPVNKRADTRDEEGTKLQRRQRIISKIRLVSQTGRSLWPHRYAIWRQGDAIWHQIVVISYDIGLWLRQAEHEFETALQHIGPISERAVHEIVEWLYHIARPF